MSNINYNVILLGIEDVGKTCLFKKLKNGIFPDKNVKTIGIDKGFLKFDININKNKKEEKKNFDITLAHFTYMEKYKNGISAYYKGKDGYIIIYDITERKTFESIEIFINNIKNHNDPNSKYIIMLIGNKLDLVNKKEKERQINEEEAIEICNQFDMIWGGEISVKEFENNKLEELMKKFVIDIYNEIGIKPQPVVKKLDDYRYRHRHQHIIKCLIY